MFYLSLLSLAISLLFLYMIVISDTNLYKNKSRTLIYYYFGYFIFFFIITTLLHFKLNYYIDIHIIDPANSLINLNIINSIGLLLTTLGYVITKQLAKPSKFVYKVDYNKIRKRSYLFIGMGVLLTTYLYLFQLGSIIKSSEVSDEGKSIFLYMFIENLPLLMGWAYISYYLQRELRPSKLSFYIMLFIIVLASLIVSGTRGSRISILLQISTYLILYGSVFRKIKFKNILIATIIAFVFNNFFSVYKYGGIEAFNEYLSTGYKPEYISNYQDNRKVILHDLGRSDVQAFIYDRVLEKEYTPPYFPHSYLYALNNIIPNSLQPSIQLYSKESLGYSAQYYHPLTKELKSTRIYGVNGEAILNFGFAGLGLSFVLFGFIIYSSLHIAQRASSYGITLFLPLITLTPIYYLFYDFGNILFMLIKTWTIPLLIFFSSSKLMYKQNATK